jgi:ferredoxin
MAFADFLEGSFLRGVFTLLVMVVLARGVLCVIRLLRKRNVGEPGRTLVGTGFVRSLLPFHSGVPRKPLSAVLHYAFHISIVAVPVLLSGHIALWQESFLQWSWMGLPDAWADGMIILVLVLSALFLARRLVLKEVRKDSSFSDYALIVVTALPFLTGYLTSHGSPGSTGNLMRSLHVLTGSAFLLLVAVLFVELRLKESACTACVSCVIRCPATALGSRDEHFRRVMEYSPSQCILCGGCVAVCPENAVGLRHMIGLRRFFHVSDRQRIQTAEMGRCKGCGDTLAALPQVEQVRRKLSQEYVYYCEKCKRDRIARQKLTPLWEGQPTQEGETA